MNRIKAVALSLSVSLLALFLSGCGNQGQVAGKSGFDFDPGLSNLESSYATPEELVKALAMAQASRDHEAILACHTPRGQDLLVGYEIEGISYAAENEDGPRAFLEKHGLSVEKIRETIRQSRPITKEMHEELGIESPEDVVRFQKRKGEEGYVELGAKIDNKLKFLNTIFGEYPNKTGEGWRDAFAVPKIEKVMGVYQFQDLERGRHWLIVEAKTGWLVTAN